MSDVLLSEEYTLVIDTDSPACAFADCLVAYCTGLFNELEIQEVVECANTFEEQSDQRENPFCDQVAFKELDGTYIVGIKKDGEPVLTPCCIMLNSNYGEDDKGNFAKLTEENYNQFDYPAPFSVGIFFRNKPEQHLIEIIKKRAIDFFKSFYKQIEIYRRDYPPNNVVTVEGFRLISYAKYAKEEQV